MKELGKYCIFEGELKFNFNTSTGWIFPIDDNKKLDLNKFGVDLRWRMSVMRQDINNRHKTKFNNRQIQNMIKMVTDNDNLSGYICIDDNENLILQ